MTKKEEVKVVSSQKTEGSPVSTVIRVAGVAIAFAGLYLVSRYFGQIVDVEGLQEFVRRAGPLAPIVYMLFYLIAPTIFFPASVLTMTGGALFGPLWGTVYTIFSATLGATIPFLITRRYGRKPLEKLLAKSDNFDERFRAFEQDVSKQGWKYVAFTRLVTLFPFLILNYAFGLTSIKLWTYVWASFVFMLPGSFMFNYMGYAGREALGGSEDAVTKISIAVGCFILLTALPGLVKRLKEKAGR